MNQPLTFADYKTEGHNWITLATGEYYPDILIDACKLYQPVLELFGQLVKTSESLATESAPETFSLLAVEPYDNNLDKLLKININRYGE